MDIPRLVLAAALISTVAYSIPSTAQPTENSDETAGQQIEEQHTEHAEHDGDVEEHGGRTHHKNDVAFFLGVTDKEGERGEFTWGFEYARAIAPRWGIGVVFDYAGGELRNAVFGIPVFFYPGGRWILSAAPGIEFHRGTGELVTGHKSEPIVFVDRDETLLLFRLGVGYDIPVADDYSILPKVDVDFVDGHRIWVYGLNFVYKF